MVAAFVTGGREGYGDSFGGSENQRMTGPVPGDDPSEPGSTTLSSLRGSEWLREETWHRDAAPSRLRAAATLERRDVEVDKPRAQEAHGTDIHSRFTNHKVSGRHRKP
ncbi:hypothetical protein EYF80_021723 [Liparis tanakae]|uniref:Uncharacterized protein n=1 Tax=Liparis tanakae TaxID=230148 RepID=A0A4Z2HQP9_9TELE|nr:hypothetical protein EYF80_021723 [Liparis tanakae]